MNNGFTGTITSTATFNSDVQTREIDFIYDHNGMRTTKIVSENGRLEITEYTLHGKLITHMTKRTVDESGAESTEELHFFYDAQSRPAFVEYNGVKYRYVHNLQGDVVGIVDSAGNLVVEYKYDAWGKSLSITGTLKTSLGRLNLFRYRGYVYDWKLGLYYLKNRFYYPERSRFVNADTLIGRVGVLLKHGLFAYCENSAIMKVDKDGMMSEPYQFSDLIRKIGTIIIAINKVSKSSGKVLQQKWYKINSAGGITITTETVLTYVPYKKIDTYYTERDLASIDEDTVAETIAFGIGFNSIVSPVVTVTSGFNIVNNWLYKSEFKKARKAAKENRTGILVVEIHSTSNCIRVPYASMTRILEWDDALENHTFWYK